MMENWGLRPGPVWRVWIPVKDYASCINTGAHVFSLCSCVGKHLSEGIADDK